MKKVITLTVLSVFVMCAAFCSVAGACSGTSNSVNAERYTYPGDGDDAYATTNGTQCGSGWGNHLEVGLVITYDANGDGIYEHRPKVSNAGTNVASVSVDDTCPSNTGIWADGTYTNLCNRCSPYPQVLCRNATARDTY